VGNGYFAATLPAQTRRFKLRISAILCKNSSDLFLDTKGQGYLQVYGGVGVSSVPGPVQVEPST
jgi:hypothetical protein